MMKNTQVYHIARAVTPCDWGSIAALEMSHAQWQPDCGIRAATQVCYNDQALYVHQAAVEASIRAEYSAALSPVHEDSCLEFFFMPENETRYFNFEVNPNACLHVGFGYNRTDRSVIYRRDYESLFALTANRTASGWEVFYRIPYSFLRIFLPDFQLKPGVILYANCYKCGDKTEHPHYLAWNRVTSETPDFHRPQDFGIMRME